MSARRSVLMAGIAVVVVVGVAAAVLVARRTPSAASGTPVRSVALFTTKVARTNLATTQQASGTIGYESSWTVARPSGSSTAAIAQALNAVDQAAAELAGEQTAANDAATLAAQQVAAAKTAYADSTGAPSKQRKPLASALKMAQLDQTSSAHDHESKLAAAAQALTIARTTLADLQATALVPGSTVTAVPAVGDVIARGQPLYAVDGRAVPLFYGDTPQYRAWQLGMSDGHDVGILTANLIALGFGSGLTQSDHFGEATRSAVMAWQQSIGVDPSGVVALGAVGVLPDAVRVAAVAIARGAAIQPGTVLEGTSTTPVVTIAVPVTKRQLAHTGDAVSVVLPDGSKVPATIRTVAKTATCPSSGQAPKDGSACGSDTPVIAVTIALANPALASNFDQAPVTAVITDKSVKAVLAVPINALLATASGGDAVEVVSTDGTHRLVAVTTGLFSATLVEISGGGITEGALVEVPSS